MKLKQVEYLCLWVLDIVQKYHARVCFRDQHKHHKVMISVAKACMRVALFSVAASVVARVAASVTATVVYEP